jgi:hypothetical protein
VRRLIHLALLLFVFIVPALAQNGSVQYFCQDGGITVTTQGIQSTTLVQASYPQCLINVYLTGTLTRATIHPTIGGGTLGNPFRANTNGSWLFYAVQGVGLDVVMTDGIPIPLPIPITLVDIFPSSGGSGGSGCSAQGNENFQLSNGSGGCVAADADFGITIPDTFTFGASANHDFAINAGSTTNGESLGFNLSNTKATLLSSGTGLDIEDGSDPTHGAINIVEESHNGGIVITDNGGGISIEEKNLVPSDLDGNAINMLASGGFLISNDLQSISTNPQSFPLTLDNGSNPSNLTPDFPGEYGMNIEDETADGIYIDEEGTGQISLAANTVNISTLTDTSFKVNGEVVCTASNSACAQLTPQSFPAITCNSGTEGSLAAFNNSSVNTWGSTITGSGSFHVLGYCDGSNWTVAGK